MLKRLLRQLLGTPPESVAGLIARSRDERERGDPATSLATLEVVLRREATNAEALAELGPSCRALGRYDEACAVLERAAVNAPGSMLPLMYIGNLAHEAGRLDEAISAYRRGLVLDAGNASLHYNLALSLLSRGEAADAVEAFRACLAAAPDFPDARASLLFALNLSDRDSAERTAAEHFDWGRRVADPLWRDRTYSNAPEPQRTLRIGYVSADFFGHAATDFIHSFLAQHERDGYAISCYCNAPVPDAKLGLHGHAWRDISGLDDTQAAALVESEAIDILVDLSGHTRGNRLLLFARKPAPLQMTFLGYPNTTGMRAMDYRLTDAYADPPEASRGRYRERLLRMPQGLWCYQPQDEDTSAPGPLPALQSGHVTFGSMNNVAKLNAGVVGLWAELLLRVKDAQLLMATVPPGEARARLLRVFVEKGVDAQRIRFSERLDKPGFRALHQQVDIALDAYPCNGGATTCETLWLGVPVLSLAGDEFRTRAGLSLLNTVGLPQLVARDSAEFLAIAADLASDTEKLQALRAGLREAMRVSPLCDAAGYTRALEAIYRGIWSEWCTGAFMAKL
ncbi:MAG: tetratricopeptide repeat protein [Burkholderiales bacterium]|nr:tetratricopeptide repeat protein [Burkholderiales bacterium]